MVNKINTGYSQYEVMVCSTVLTELKIFAAASLSALRVACGLLSVREEWLLHTSRMAVVTFPGTSPARDYTSVSSEFSRMRATNWLNQAQLSSSVTREQGQSSRRAKSPPFWTGRVDSPTGPLHLQLAAISDCFQRTPKGHAGICVWSDLLCVSAFLNSLLSPSHYSVLVILIGKLHLHFCLAVDVFLRHMHMHSECIVEEDAREKNTTGEETPGKSQ